MCHVGKMLYRLKSSIVRMIRRREFVHHSPADDDVTKLSSLNTKCLHTNDKRLLWILFTAFCGSVLLQKMFLNKSDTDIIAPAQSDEFGRRHYGGSFNFSLPVDTDTTVVTAFFDLGDFISVDEQNVYSKSSYLKWTRNFKYVLNPLVLYTDSEKFAELMTSLRTALADRTKVYIIDRNSSWSFKKKTEISKVLNNLPHEINSDYACAQIAKYDVISRAAKEDVFKTKYYTWVDIGYFRTRTSKRSFVLRKPNNFHEHKVATSVLNFNPRMNSHIDSIFRENAVWLDLGLLFGEKHVLIEYEKQFKRATNYFISRGVLGTDQQITYAMFCDDGRAAINPEVELQLYTPPIENDHFYLGVSMVHEIS